MYSYTPTYYSTLHDSITSLCKTILPFSFKKRRLPAAEQKLSKLQSDNLKWQQDSFHQILKLMGLCKEGILAEHEVSSFRSHLLETLIASPADQEQPVILRDKLLFLQELFYAKCITADEYHSSKRPLLQRLAVQGAEIEARDVIVANQKENSEEEWSVIDLRDEQCLLSKESSNSKSKSKHEKSIIGPVSEHSGHNELGLSRENPFWNIHLKEKESETRSILMPESIPVETVKVEKSGADKAKKKVFRTLFQKEGSENVPESEEKVSKSGKKQWGFEGLKKWKRNNWEDETTPLPLSERSDIESYLGPCQLVASPIGEGPDTKQIKRKIHSNGSSSDFFIDKVLGEKIKKELSLIQTELNTTNHNLQFSNDQIEAISTKLPVDKADLKKFFPKSWCDRYGDVVLDVVKKEFKDHVGEMESMRNAAREKRGHSTRWTTFEDDENCHPNLFAHQDHSFQMKQTKLAPSKEDYSYISNIDSSNTKCFENNPFFHDYSDGRGEKPRSELGFYQDQNQNPFWSPKQGSSVMG
ncbi:unnamed protein product, partial [Vitis vinifera]